MMKAVVITLVLLVASSDAWWLRRRTSNPIRRTTTTTLATPPISSGKSACTHSKSSKTVTCTSPSGASVTCATVSASWWSGSTPSGTFLIENVGWRADKSTNWYNLNPRRKDGLYHDYYDWNPDTRRKNIALHGGTRSAGCITVSDDDCYTQLRAVINAGTGSTQTVHRRWPWYFSSGTTRTITYIGTMVVS